ncbi:pollen-specific leucine-rich repeat extensin-like protein 1 [Ostrinia furnacalis]|uniref:pollen-specific leucine-rich repeat extensin-like protein 1 n=1 Tax=Ostrinia furnacalis TaxID=93504 RepID=UPI0010386BD8|nr:pollen-specific leucine-rich repeat extensin-like protein 1 [Ostrinia furnacalis]
MQIHVPVYPPPVMIPPPPIQVAVAMPIPIVIKTTTTTTTESPVAFAYPVPVPMPVQMAIPAHPPPQFCQAKPRPKNCPPCPPCVCMPSCTPSFFSYCSPCHQKCRCRNGMDAPMPQPLVPPQPVPGPAFAMPAPMLPPPPPPIMMVPVPPLIRRRPRPRPVTSSDSSEGCGSDTDSDSSAGWYVRAKRRRRLRRWRGKKWMNRRMGRNRQLSDFSDGEVIKPVLTYLANNGDIKIRKRLSNNEAERLVDDNEIDDGRRRQKYDIVTGRGRNPKSNVLLVSAGEDEEFSGDRKRHVVLRSGIINRKLKAGRKELIFKPPVDKKITNLSVSFQVADRR